MLILNCVYLISAINAEVQWHSLFTHPGGLPVAFLGLQLYWSTVPAGQSQEGLYNEPRSSAGGASNS